LLEELQDVLLQADLGVATSDDIVNEVRSLALDTEEDGEVAAGGKKNKEIVSREDLMSIMRGVLIETLDFEKKADNIPTVLFVMGANGMGKTTTIGKLANRLRVEGNQKVLVAACDTFRAGAVEQLQMWADKAQVDLIGPSEKGGSTPTSIIGDALDKAKAENYDTVLVDTAGRLSNNWELNEELVRMKEMIQEKLSADPDNKLNPDVPHEILLVLDAAQGRMALDSARVWNKELGLTGLILTKLDGSARGGSVVAISRDLNVPVKLIGVGEGIDDLKDFEGEKFVDGLL
ncbi:SRP54-domain-containing protein, partial [Fragilariopsis cylindrus CCMP1102]